ncbi:hypothetical protein CHS0354_028348 [Potamilus streckersoni]|uniref:Cilia-and flagella-associated protein 96 n=1 Tax=Potamilus streckersoni TaxID=2493646 RepID=A0AAE0RTV1_9BIVA|nr:hypothetical protein CHS0354_028348 [Potamilus streckersoni]
MGERGGKSDMDRIGVFQEMGYITIGDRYKTPGIQFNEVASKGKQLLPGGSKLKSALQHGYFDAKFTRVLEGESYTDPIKLRRQHRLREAQKNLGKAFLPSSVGKKMSGLGNHYGTLSGPIGAFSPTTKPGKEYKSPGKNFTTNPSKKGTGYGFIHITIGHYPLHQADPNDAAKEIMKKENAAHKGAMKGPAFRLNMHPKTFFDPSPYTSDRPLGKRAASAGAVTRKDDNKPFKPSSPGKKPGGLKAGTFDPYPNHSADPYKVAIPRTLNVVNKSGRTFLPSQGPKSSPTVSIINQNVMRQVKPHYNRPTVA